MTVTDLTSDDFKFHIRRLLKLEFITKNLLGSYELTPAGKEYTSRLKTDDYTILKQPKISVVLVVERRSRNRREFLCQQRTKQPYLGFWGRLGGKVHWGESFEEAATRELLEETGLHGEFTFKMVFRKRDYEKGTSRLLEDKAFMIMFCDNASGELITDFDGGHNEWLTQEELVAKDKVFESARDFVDLIDNGISYHSQDYIYESDEY